MMVLIFNNDTLTLSAACPILYMREQGGKGVKFFYTGNYSDNQYTSSRFSSNSGADASELLKNLEEIVFLVVNISV